MSKQHEGFRFWENLEKKSGSQDSTPRLNSEYALTGFVDLETRKTYLSFQVVTRCCQRWPQKLRKQSLTSRDWKEWITWRWAWQIWAWSKTWRAGSLGSGCLQARSWGRWRTGKQQQGHPGVPIHHFTAKNENESFEGKCKEKQFFRKMSKGRRRQKLTMLTFSFLFAVCSFPY